MSIIGSILGDIAGSQVEFGAWEGFDYRCSPLFSEKCKITDDTVMTLATKYALQNRIPFYKAYQLFGRKYADVGYGGLFRRWINSDKPVPYSSYGNGSAMRVSPVIDYSGSIIECREFAYWSAVCTHNHPEGLKGAVAIAELNWMATNKASKKDIYRVAKMYYPQSLYHTNKSLEWHRENHVWNATCPGVIPLAICCIMESNSYEEFIRNVLSVRCDADTVCAIGGSIAEELFGGTGFNNNAILREYLDDYQMSILNEKPNKYISNSDKYYIFKYEEN